MNRNSADSKTKNTPDDNRDSKPNTGIMQPNNVEAKPPTTSKLKQLFINISDALTKYQESFITTDITLENKAKQNKSLENLALALSFLGEEIDSLGRKQLIAAIPPQSNYDKPLGEEQLKLLKKIPTSVAKPKDSKINTGGALKRLMHDISTSNKPKTRKLAVQLQDSLYEKFLDNRKLYFDTLKTIFEGDEPLKSLSWGKQLPLIKKLSETVNNLQAGQNTTLSLGISCLNLLANPSEVLDQDDPMIKDMDDKLDGDNQQRTSRDSHSDSDSDSDTHSQTLVCDAYLEISADPKKRESYFAEHKAINESTNRQDRASSSIIIPMQTKAELDLISTISSPKKDDSLQKIESEILKMVHAYGLLERKILIEINNTYRDPLFNARHKLDKKQNDLHQKLRQALYFYRKDPNLDTFAEIYLQYHAACINAIDDFYEKYGLIPPHKATTERYCIQELKIALATPTQEHKNNESSIKSSERLARFQFTFHQHKKNLAEKNYPIVNLLIKIIEKIVWGYRQITDRTHHKATFFSLNKNIHQAHSSYKKMLSISGLRGAQQEQTPKAEPHNNLNNAQKKPQNNQNNADDRSEQKQSRSEHQNVPSRKPGQAI